MRGSSVNCSSSDRGIVDSSTPGTSRPRRLCQNRLVANAVVHHLRHRTSVRRLTPSSASNVPTCFLVGPCCIAAASTTTAPK